MLLGQDTLASTLWEAPVSGRDASRDIDCIATEGKASETVVVAGMVGASAFLNCLWVLQSRQLQRTKIPERYYLSFLPAYAPHREQRKKVRDAGTKKD